MTQFAQNLAALRKRAGYTQETLERTAHNYELVPCKSTVVCLDYRQAGIGSDSCGPALLEKYQLREERFTFAVKMLPRC